LFTKEGQSPAFGPAIRSRFCSEELVMRRIVPLALTLAASAAALLTILGSAEAQDRYRRGYVITGERPLTVTRRSWLDPGPVVQPMYEHRYIAQQVYFNQLPFEASHGKFLFNRYTGP
jgi:hypothetical protein